jgi:IS5 family transposase
MEKNNKDSESRKAPKFDDFINKENFWCNLESHINWDLLLKEFGETYSDKGQPDIPTKVMIGLYFIKCCEDFTDEEVLDAFEENIYYQYLCGYKSIVFDAPCEEKNMRRWRKKVGEERLMDFLGPMIDSALESAGIEPRDYSIPENDINIQ